MGEAAALSLSKGMRRGQNSPVDKWSEKTSPGALGTKEKAPALSREPRANTFERYQNITAFLTDYHLQQTAYHQGLNVMMEFIDG